MSFGVSGRFMEPAAVVSHFHLRDGDAVADFGAGAGNFIKALSTAVGTSGTVYACEIQKNLVDTLGMLAQREHLANVRPLWCDLEAPGGTKLADGVLDAGILVNTLFQFENKQVALAEIARVTKKGGRVFVVDWTDSFGGLGPRPEAVVREDAARSLLESVGFSFERTFPAADHHYGIAARRT